MAIEQRTKWIGGGLVALASAGAAAWWLTRPKTPPSTLILKDGAIEVRAYEDLIVAQVERPGLRDAAFADGLSTLLEQLGGESVDLLAPVLSDARGEGWRTRAILAQEIDVAGIDIATLPARRVATLRFSGRADDATIARHEARLREWLEGYGLKATGPSELANYGGSSVLGTFQRHELWVPVASLY